MADTTIKLSGTYDSIEAYRILEEMRDMSEDYEDIKTEAEAAASAATAASTAATNAVNAANTAVSNAQTYAGNANASASDAAGYAANASTSATNAASSATNAHNSELAAASSESNASTSETNAAASETAAAASAAEAAATLQNYLPLAGGTMSGEIKQSVGDIISNTVDSSYTRITGGSSASNGAFLLLYGKSYSNVPGKFILRAENGSTNKDLAGDAVGSLAWNGKEVERVNASGTNYIRYESGLQIVFNSTSATTAGTKVTFPVAFKNTSYYVSVQPAGYSLGSGCGSATTTSIYFYTSATSSAASVDYIIVGWWK